MKVEVIAVTSQESYNTIGLNKQTPNKFGVKLFRIAKVNEIEHSLLYLYRKHKRSTRFAKRMTSCAF